MRKEIAALDGEVVSITRGRPSYYLNASDVILVTAPQVACVEPLQCVGQARTDGAYYRLDMELTAGETKRIPVKDVLLKGRIGNSELGITLRDGSAEAPYIPVTVSSQMRSGAVGAPDSVFVKFLPRILLRDISVEVYDPGTRAKLFTGMRKGRFKADEELMLGIPLAGLGLQKGDRRPLLVQLKSVADDGGPQLNRTFTVLFWNETAAR